MLHHACISVHLKHLFNVMIVLPFCSYNIIKKDENSMRILILCCQPSSHALPGSDIVFTLPMPPQVLT